MIRYAITDAELRKRISDVDANWSARTQALAASLPARPASSDFKPEWSKIKQVYINLQCSKCCFCEKPLEGNIEQDVEHFRPKAEVKSWKIPAQLKDEGITLTQPADGSAEPGYAKLAYHPFNYAMACKVCNSTLKGNFFPIEARRKSTANDPADLASEKPLLLYPIGSIDVDPETLIEFQGLSPVPTAKSGASRRRALVTIDIFRLDDNKRRTLFKARALLIRHLFLELEGAANARSATRRCDHTTAIQNLTGNHAPFANCLRSFKRLYDSDPARAAEFAKECLNYISTKSFGG